MPIQLAVKTVGADLVRQGLQDLDREIPRIGRQTIYDALSHAKRILSTPGAPSRSPVQWDSDRQRRFVLGMLREQNNLPYSRTGRMNSGWTMEKLDSGYRLENSNENAVYVYGNYEGARQSRIHQGRWPTMQEVIENAISGLPEAIEENLSYYGRERFG